MKRITILFPAALIVAAVSCTIKETDITDPTAKAEEATEASVESCYEQGVVTVKFSEEMAEMVEASLAEGSVMTKSSELDAFVSSYGITSIKRVFSDDERWLERQHREGLHLWYRITYDPDAILVTKAAAELSEMSGVDVAEPNPKIKLTSYYNDPYSSSQWHLSGTYDINVEPVWEYYTKGASDVIVAVVDGGIDPSHPDLRANIIEAAEGGSKNFITGKYKITAHYHGTLVGGIIAAVNDNGVGVSSIAGGDSYYGLGGVKLLNCQVFDDDTSCSAEDAIVYGADNGALISQNSWGYDYTTEEKAKAGTIPEVITTAIDYFAKYAGCDNEGNQLPDSKMKGGVVIFAAGNDGWQYAHPGDYETCIAVGATDIDGQRADYSNYGDWVDICAPGTDIFSTYYDGGSTYASASGTSMACPMVSGVAALVLAERGGPGFTADQLRECLIEGADPDKVSAQDVGPYLDALGAVTYDMYAPPEPIDSYSVSTSGNTISFTWKVPAGDATGKTPAYGARIFACERKSYLDYLDPKNPSDKVIHAELVTNSNAVGDEVTASLTMDDFNTTYYVTCAPYNFGYQFADISPIQTVTTGENRPPVITPSVDLTDLFEVGAAKQRSIAFTIEDPDGHDCTIEYKAASIAESWAKADDNTYVLTITGYAQDSSGKTVKEGFYKPTITATDSYGLSTEFRLDYRIVPNQSPEVGEILDNVLLRMGGESSKTAEMDLSDCFTDPDEDDLSYTVENTSSSTVQAVVKYEEGADGVSTPCLCLTAQKVGTAQITVVAADAAGLSCSQTFTVAVREEGESVLVYPNPFTDVLNISTDTTSGTSTTITITSSTGSVVYNESKSVSAFKPAAIKEVMSFAPGTYNVKVKYGSTEVTKKVVKN